MGNFYHRFFSQKNIESSISLANITNEDQVTAGISAYKPTCVINTAAKTNLEWCGENKLETFNVNVLGANIIANACDVLGIYFIHLSSGCIFESTNAQDEKFEDSEPKPAAYYSWTKVWAEQMIQFKKSTDFKFLILRPRQPVSTEVNSKNMLVKMLMFSKFVDTPNTGTVIEDMVQWTLELIEKNVTGVVHVANEGWVTPYDIGLLIKKHILPRLEPEKISKVELDRLTPNRRVDTVLNVDKLKGLVSEVKCYKDSIEGVIIKLGENIKSTDKAFLAQELNIAFEQLKKRSIPNTVWGDLLG